MLMPSLQGLLGIVGLRASLPFPGCLGQEPCWPNGPTFVLLGVALSRKRPEPPAPPSLVFPQHQQQVAQAVERAKQVTMTELNAIIGVRGVPNLPLTVCTPLFLPFTINRDRPALRWLGRRAALADPLLARRPWGVTLARR